MRFMGRDGSALDGTGRVSPFGLRSVKAAAIELKLAHVDAPDIWTSRKGKGPPYLNRSLKWRWGGRLM